VDASVADPEIKFATELNLLNASREHLEHIIDLLYNKEEDGVKPRDYRRVKEKLTSILPRTSVKVRRKFEKELQYVARDLKIIEKLILKPGGRHLLPQRDAALLETVQNVYQQQRWMYKNKTHVCPDRIVNLYQPHVRPMVRGKEGRNREFGFKINISEVNGFSWINTLSWDAFNEGTDLKKQVEDYKNIYGCYPKTLLADKIYLNRSNRKYLKEKAIKIFGKPLGRPPKHSQILRHKNIIKKSKKQSETILKGNLDRGTEAMD
jgi:hypothetical protein